MSRPKLFIVDDDRQVLRALKRLCVGQGYQVLTFDSPVCAGWAARRGRAPDLVISDNSMPEVDGVTFLQELRAALPATRTILLTGGPIGDRVKAAVSAGVIDAIMQKPWDWDELAECVRALLAMRTGLRR